MYDILELKSKLLTDLQDIAKNLNVPKYRSLKKMDLIYQILDVQAINPNATKKKKITSNISPSKSKPNQNIKPNKPMEATTQSKENSSYKLNLKKDNYFDQMKKFSLQKPRIRNYLHEWIFHELLGEGNLIKINYDFYDLPFRPATSQDSKDSSSDQVTRFDF